MCVAAKCSVQATRCSTAEWALREHSAAAYTAAYIMTSTDELTSTELPANDNALQQSSPDSSPGLLDILHRNEHGVWTWQQAALSAAALAMMLSTDAPPSGLHELVRSQCAAIHAWPCAL